MLKKHSHSFFRPHPTDSHLVFLKKVVWIFLMFFQSFVIVLVLPTTSFKTLLLNFQESSPTPIVSLTQENPALAYQKT